jgi:SpoVK/Ycf46/Vps4 family AAA+-type ATPase
MRLEESRCFCICTTNRRERLDKAAMRRFAFKIPFGYAKPEQIKALYAALLAPLASGPLPPDVERELCALPQLAPGDFHAVRSRHWLDDPASVPPEELAAALKHEMTLKLEEKSRSIGF